MKHLVILLMLSLGAAGQQQSTPKADCNHNTDAAAVNAVRFLNTLEYSYKQKNGKFGSLEGLKSSEEWKTTAARSPMFTAIAGSELASGYDLTVITDSAGTKYRVSAKATDNQCSTSFFSDEKGLIFQGSPLH